MAKYARKKDGCWVDVFTAPGDFPDVETLGRCLPGDAFIAVDDSVRHGDFVDGEAGYISRPAFDEATPPREKTNIEVLLEKVTGLEEKLVTVEAKIDAIAPT